MNETEQRQGVIAEAMTWLGTAHHNGARIKGVGIDCGQFPLAVYEACGLIPPTTTQRYSPHFHLSKDEEWYLSFCQQLGKELPEGCDPKEGDFAIYKVGRVFSHGAIIIDWPKIIHSYVRVGVCLDLGNKGWMAQNKDGSPRPIKFFTLW
jgi:cell wall-associated NlpC family hydrolase